MSVRDDILIRETHPLDYERLKGFLERNNTSETTRHFRPFPLTAETAKWITYTPKQDRYYLALFGDQVVGLCMLRGWDEGFPVPSFGVMVDRAFSGKGIGKLMTEYAVEEAKKLGCKQIRLSVYASNVAAYHLYSSLGFKEINREDVEVQGKMDENIIMVQDLEVLL
jgi:ribosomal protein S18 acetylase RimI-like enzyme